MLNSPYKISIVVLSIFIFFSCKAGSVLNPAKGYQENQPEYPIPKDDKFFLEKSDDDETFRVLITDDNYSVRQVKNKGKIHRKTDDDGDREQLEFFKKKAQRIKFRDWNLEGVLSIRLNPLTRQIEHQSYTLGGTPKTWQSTEYFIEDFSRFQFQNVGIRKFRVKYLWRIKKRPGLSDEQAKEMAIEYLKSQTKR